MTALVWFRRDLRVHDHPPLHLALRDHETVVPVFVLDPRLLEGRFPSANRAAFLFGALEDLHASLRERGGELIVRAGAPERVLVDVAGRRAPPRCASPPTFRRSPAAGTGGWRKRCARRGSARGARANFVADTREEKPFQVFSAFHRRWEARPRRPAHPAPPGGSRGRPGSRPERSRRPVVPHHVPGEAAGRKRLHAWLRRGVEDYVGGQNRLAAGTSELSMYLHFGCVSAREAEETARAAGGVGADKFAASSPGGTSTATSSTTTRRTPGGR